MEPSNTVEIVIELIVTPEMRERILRRRQPVKPIGEPIVGTEVGIIELGEIG